jgi:Ca-activated chloride channel homolog
VKTKRFGCRERGSVHAFALSALLCMFYGSSAAQVPPPANGKDTEAFRISVDVGLVVLQATVHEPGGRSVAGLAQGDFEVYEDGVLQPVRLFRHEDTPVTIGLVVDHSGSMREKLRDVTAAARAFVQYSNPEDQMFVVNFNDGASLGLPPSKKFSNSADELGRAIGEAPAVGTTALYDAVVEALQGLQQGKWDKKALIVFSDGGDNSSNATLDRVLKLAEQSSAVIYTIGIYDESDPDRNPKVLRRLARETGGEAFFPSELKETAEICKRIAREVRDQYTIGFTPANSKPGLYHNIRVTARSKDRGKLSVRTRAGYMSGGEPQSPKSTR